MRSSFLMLLGGVNGGWHARFHLCATGRVVKPLLTPFDSAQLHQENMNVASGASRRAGAKNDCDHSVESPGAPRVAVATLRVSGRL